MLGSSFNLTGSWGLGVHLENLNSTWKILPHATLLHVALSELDTVDDRLD